MDSVPAKNSLVTHDGVLMMRSVCSRCGHFICETHLDRSVDVRTANYCPSCKSMVLIRVLHAKWQY